MPNKLIKTVYLQENKPADPSDNSNIKLDQPYNTSMKYSYTIEKKK
jgi:hypothetical protein